MVKFTDRVAELALFESRFKNLKQGELVILTGRRRVGKTELIRKFFEKIPSGERLYLFVDEGTPQDMLRALSEDIASEWPKERPAFSNWDEFLSFLESKARQSGKLVVAIDEFQRLHADPRAFSRLQKAWDTKLKNAPIMLILLGSAVSAIHKIAIGHRSPLFGRATAKIALEPFDYQAFREALANAKLSEEDKIRLFATFGGVPRYLQFAEETAGTPYLDVVENNILKKNSLLREEPSTILQMELKDTGRYNSILAAIANGHRTLKEISDQTGIPSAGLTFYADKLGRALRLIERRSPVCGKLSPQYVLKDNFFKFWYKFVAKNTSALEIGNYSAVREKVRSEIDGMTGPVFEDIVRELVAKYNGKKMLEMPVKVELLGGWWDRSGNEIDVCGQSNNSLLLGEVRWRKEPADYEDVGKFLKKRELVRCTPMQKSNSTLFFFSKSGFTEAAVRYLDERGCYHFDLSHLTRLFDALPNE